MTAMGRLLEWIFEANFFTHNRFLSAQGAYYVEYGSSNGDGNYYPCYAVPNICNLMCSMLQGCEFNQSGLPSGLI